ncbi:MAG: BspA family leucine-rich repeat surface protein, partial [Proteobacteria bacterium]|nr:BspA family leucine-rich repeat surface protein [Pseudomonadota bacterium]
TKCDGQSFKPTSTVCPGSCFEGSCSDLNGNHINDDLEKSYADLDKSCSKQSDCAAGGLCDLVRGKCAPKCADQSWCDIGYVCRGDGICAPEAFVTEWKIWAYNDTIELPTATATECNFTVDWGQGTNGGKETFTSCPKPNLKHKYNYKDKGTLVMEIKITGTFDGFSMGNKDASYMDPENQLRFVGVKSFGPVGLGAGAFAHAANMTKLSTVDVPDASKLKDMSAMFYGVKQLTSGVANWNVSNVTSMSHTFNGAEAFNEDLSKWDTSKVMSLNNTFRDAKAFNGNITTWDVSNVKILTSLFYGAENFNQPIGNWNVSKVTNMNHTFDGAKKFNQDISKWDVSNVEKMASMFRNAESFNKPLEAWGNKVSKVQEMQYMFSGAQKFNQPLKSWKTSSVTNMESMFSNSAFNYDISSWDVSKVTNMKSMFYHSPFNQYIGDWNVSNVTNMRAMFSHAESFNQDIRKWDVSKVTDMTIMFSGAVKFNQNLDSWNVSSVMKMGSMFEGATAFNGSINSWDVSRVQNMSSMFRGARAFNQPLDKWGTKISSVTTMSSMFECALSFNQDVTKWDMKKVHSIDKMFYLARKYSKIPSSWQPTYVVNTCNSSKICDSVSDLLTCSEVNFVNAIDDMADKWGLKKPCSATLRTLGQDCAKLEKSCP